MTPMTTMQLYKSKFDPLFAIYLRFRFLVIMQPIVPLPRPISLVSAAMLHGPCA